MKLPGFQFEETMAGEWRPADGSGPERPLSFTVRARTPDLWTYLRTSEVTLEGTLEMEGFADHVPCTGTLLISPLRRGSLRYELEFVAKNGQRCQLAGEKQLSPTKLFESVTVMAATIVERSTGRAVGNATVRFDVKSELPKMLRSFRPFTGE